MAVVMFSVAAVCMLLAPAVDAHGWIQQPLARHLCNGDKVHPCSPATASIALQPGTPRLKYARFVGIVFWMLDRTNPPGL